MFQVDKEKCIGCGACINICPVGAISLSAGQAGMVNDKAQIDINKCMDCGRCAQVCPQDAIHPGSNSQRSFPLNQGQNFPNYSSGIGRGTGRGLGRGMGRGLGGGPRDGRGSGRGGGGRRR